MILDCLQAVEKESLLFHRFASQEERRRFGGSYFIEIQYCCLSMETALETLISVEAITHWKNDSLYIYGDDDTTFLSHYGDIFTDGIYSNGKSGAVDPCGINYYTREHTLRIIRDVEERKPLDHLVLLHWLDRAMMYKGFYILGL